MGNNTLLLWALLQSVCLGQFTRPDFTGRRHLSVAAVDGHLYIHGGEPSGINDTRYFETASLNLAESWPASSPTVSPLNWLDNGRRTTAQQMLGYRAWAYALWKMPGTNSLLSWGGFRTANRTTGDFVSTDRLDRNVWTLAADSQGVANWVPRDVAGGGEFTGDATAAQWGPGWGSSTACGGFGVYMGGLTAGGGNDKAPFGTGWSTEGTLTAGMVVYDIVGRKWSREDVPGSVLPGPVVGGSAVCIPHLGKKGLFMFLGGFTGTAGKKMADGTAAAVAMDRLVFYDPVDKRWFVQKATGDVPSGRSSFCAAGVKGKGSFEVFLHAGDESPNQRKEVGDTYILSIPGMNWVRALHNGEKKSGHACDVIGGRHLAIVGGSAVDTTTTANASALPTTSGVRLLDMVQLRLVDGYNASADGYQSPSAVQGFYDAGLQRSVEWTDGDVKAVLTGQPLDTPKSGPSAGVIAGAVVGALALGAIILSAVWFLLRRRRAAKKDTLLQEPPSEATDPKAGEAAGYSAKPEMDAGGIVLARAELHDQSSGNPELDGKTVGERPELEGGTLLGSPVSTAGVSEMGTGTWTAAELHGGGVAEMEGSPVVGEAGRFLGQGEKPEGERRQPYDG